VGNIPFDATEQQLIEFLSVAGEVVNFKIAYDRESGKPKGYGFCEFKDPRMAESAIRNLNGQDFLGRALRIDTADADSLRKGRKGRSNMSKQRPKSSAKKTVDEITAVVDALSPKEKIEILAQMKQLISDNEQGARDLLSENPQLAQALLLIQMSFDLVTADDIKKLTEEANPTKPNSVQLSHVPVAPSRPMPMHRPPSRYNMPPQNSMMSSHRAQPPPPSTGGPTNVVAALPTNQQKLLQRVLNLPEEQIHKLPPNLQAQVVELKRKLGGANPSFPPPPPRPGGFQR